MRSKAFQTHIVATFNPSYTVHQLSRPAMITLIRGVIVEDGGVVPGQTIKLYGDSIKELRDFLTECLNGD